MQAYFKNQPITPSFSANMIFEGSLPSVTLRADSWDNKNEQTVVVPGVLADESKQMIIPASASTSQSAYYAARIFVVSQSTDALTFRADLIPEEDLTVYVAVMQPKDSGVDDESAYVWWSPHMTSANTPVPYTVTASSAFPNYPFYEYCAFDGSTTSFWHTNSNTDTNPWLMFDFGAKARIDGFRISERNGEATQAPCQITVDGSYDGTVFETIANFTAYPQKEDGWYIYELSKVDYRYYRFSNLRSTYTVTHCIAFSELQFRRFENEVIA